MSEDVYKRLREFMDKLPAGYPETPTGVEIRILKKLFTPDEAELTMKLKTEPEEVPAIAKRIGVDEKELAEKLENMAQKGLIYRVRSGDEFLYQAFQFIVGVYEFQVHRVDKEFSELIEEYMPYMGLHVMSLQTRQLRVIPVESAVGKEKGVAPYNRVRELVEKEEIFMETNCLCRKQKELLGNKCDKPRGHCLGFGEIAQYYIDSNMGREITKEECLQILEKSEELGLVLSPMNTERIMSLCSCCTCCCPVLSISKMTPRPADLVHSYYEAKIHPDECRACGDCIERCPMDAIEEGENVSKVIEGRCIGCGLCVSVCPAEAISLLPKPGMEAPPKDMTDMINRLAQERGV